MKWYFSNNEGGFYPEDTLSYCDSIGGLPDDLEEVTQKEHGDFTGLNPDGKIPFYNKSTKKMIWIDAPAIEHTQEQLITLTNQKKSSLMSEANKTIAPLQDAVDLAIATEEETTQLIAWKNYRVLLNRVDISLAPDIDWPLAPDTK